jgi:hypothetical protein
MSRKKKDRLKRPQPKGCGMAALCEVYVFCLFSRLDGIGRWANLTKEAAAIARSSLAD